MISELHCNRLNSDGCLLRCSDVVSIGLTTKGKG